MGMMYKIDEVEEHEGQPSYTCACRRRFDRQDPCRPSIAGGRLYAGLGKAGRAAACTGEQSPMSPCSSRVTGSVCHEPRGWDCRSGRRGHVSADVKC
jgi:hypothetical protein